MLELVIRAKEVYDEELEEFINVPERKIRLEHSLVSISKWESKWKKPFLKPNYNFTKEEFIDYVKCMTITQNVPSDAYEWMNNDELKIVMDYINDDHTATTFRNIGERQNKRTRQTVTSELIYYWMTAYNIPMECQCWHLGRLLTLVRICNIKNSSPKKMSQREILEQNRRLNEERKKQLKTRG